MGKPLLDSGEIRACTLAISGVIHPSYASGEVDAGILGYV